MSWNAIASHVRRLAPSNTPLAALETLAMQVVLNSQPVFDPRSAREWVKSFELPDEAEKNETRRKQRTSNRFLTMPKQMRRKKKAKKKKGQENQSSRTHAHVRFIGQNGVNRII